MWGIYILVWDFETSVSPKYSVLVQHNFLKGGVNCSNLGTSFPCEVQIHIPKYK